jgi:antitoxin VapB
MGEEYRARIFKSGNSVALRLPKALGLKEGTEVIVREERGEFTFKPAEEAPRFIDLTGIAGSIPDFRPFGPEEREIEERELDWEGKLLRRG